MFINVWFSYYKNYARLIFWKISLQFEKPVLPNKHTFYKAVYISSLGRENSFHIWIDITYEWYISFAMQHSL